MLRVILSITQGRISAQTTTDSTTAQSSRAPDSTAANDRPEWLFPITELNERLPKWLRIGGQYRNRFESPSGIKYARTRDFYLLNRLRVHATIQPKEWLRFRAEVQDSRIFFNHHIPNANPEEATWTLWEAYAQIGSSTEGWVDVVAGRQVLAFGDERVIGPSNWLNVGRTFNAVRLDLHHSDNKVSVFASSVVPGDSATYTSTARKQSVRSLRKFPDDHPEGNLRATFDGASPSKLCSAGNARSGTS